mgnify:CR=1 FL=1
MLVTPTYTLTNLHKPSRQVTTSLSMECSSACIITCCSACKSTSALGRGVYWTDAKSKYTLCGRCIVRCKNKLCIGFVAKYTWDGQCRRWDGDVLQFCHACVEQGINACNVCGACTDDGETCTRCIRLWTCVSCKSQHLPVTCRGVNFNNCVKCSRYVCHSCSNSKPVYMDRARNTLNFLGAVPSYNDQACARNGGPWCSGCFVIDEDPLESSLEARTATTACLTQLFPEGVKAFPDVMVAIIASYTCGDLGKKPLCEYPMTACERGIPEYAGTEPGYPGSPRPPCCSPA